MTDEESEIAKLSSRFEAVKVAMTQDKNGHILKLAVHPDDTPETIMRDHVGTRYMVVLVRIGEEGEAVPAKADQEGAAAVKYAAMLCADQRFQTWLVEKQLADEVSEQAAAAAVRTYCNVRSRSELKQNKSGRDRLLALRADFAENIRHKQYR